MDNFAIPLPAFLKLRFDVAQFLRIFGAEVIASYPAHCLFGGTARERFHA
jgi:hypothetical protein